MIEYLGGFEPEVTEPVTYELNKGGREACITMLRRLAGDVSERVNEDDLNSITKLIFARSEKDFCPEPMDVVRAFDSLISNGVGLQSPKGVVQMLLRYKEAMEVS